MTPRLYAMSAAIALTAGTAVAQDDSAFSALDTDGSGGVSLAELQAAGANVTEETFALYDTDASGELSLEEYSAWAGGGR